MSTIVTRYGKGSPLTWLEVDDNFTNLNTDKIQSGNTVASLTITSATINGGTITGITDLAVADGGTGLSSLTAGYIPYGAGTSAFGSSANLFWDSANNRLGIGTATPGSSLVINQNSSYTGTPTNPNNGLHLIAANSGNVGTSYDTFAASSQITFRRSNGTINSPSALLSGNVLGAITWRGYGATSYASANRGLIQLAAAENWTDSAQGTYLQFNTVASGTTTSSEKMRIDSSGNVGIGTTSPATKLDVSGNLRFSAANPTIELNNGGAQVYSTSANTLQFASGGGIGSPTERMRITSAGDVGIGTTTPQAQEDIVFNNTASSKPIIRLGAASATTTTAATDGGFINYQNNNRLDISRGWHWTNGANFYSHATTGSCITLDESANILFLNGTGLSAGGNSNLTERMRIDSSGNVGIGTTSPDGKLDIATGGSTDVVAALGGTFPAFTYRNGSGAWFHAGKHPSSDYFYIGNGGTPTTNINLVIDSTGNVLVGTTTTAGAASNNALVVGGVFNSLNGTTASLANGASASIVTSTANLSFYQVFANCVGNTTVFASALIYFNGAGTATVQSIMGAGMSISSSGANIITVTNSAGSSQQISWTVTRYK
jgi:hypothetical protein